MVWWDFSLTRKERCINKVSGRSNKYRGGTRDAYSSLSPPVLVRGQAGGLGAPENTRFHQSSFDEEVQVA